jgi:hypothetical protein
MSQQVVTQRNGDVSIKPAPAAGAAAGPVFTDGPTELSPTHNADLDALVRTNYVIGTVHLGLGAALCFTFWAAYVWPFVLAFGALGIAAFAVNHFADSHALFTNNCGGCAPVWMVGQIRHAYMVECFVAVWVVFSTCFAVSRAHGVVRAFAILALLTSALLFAASIAGIVYAARLRKLYVVDPRYAAAMSQQLNRGVGAEEPAAQGTVMVQVLPADAADAQRDVVQVRPYGEPAQDAVPYGQPMQGGAPYGQPAVGAPIGYGLQPDSPTTYTTHPNGSEKQSAPLPPSF